MSCTAASPCPSECALPSKPAGRGSGPQHPRHTTCAQFPPLWGNRLTSELSQKLKQLMKTAECHRALNAQRDQRGTPRTSEALTIARFLSIFHEMPGLHP